MKESYRIITISILLLGTSYNLSAQDIIEKLSKKLCKCIEKQEVKNANEIGPCFEDLLINNWKEIKEHYKAETMEDINMEEVGNKIGAKMIKECPYVLDNFPSGVVGDKEKVDKQPDLNCEDLKKGDFYYLTERPESGIVDTTFVTISNDMFLERMKSGKTYSLLNIKWKENCEFDLLFKESNDPMKKEFSKNGDVYEYEILTNSSESVFLKTTWMDRSYQFELIKIK
ncbi:MULTISPECIES: hypothetical protein [Croceibacter]|uniref:hypothetical protein n=1 Tax=Croceibacter TaxID=216431 RepID=UPI000C3B06AB|nr:MULTISPECIES: hypothetical protein [Croceibacter]MBG26779.1 hypothetical protein [Croceibacter sp.]|tara:strand:- start:203 stop:886 length:684 start_codon:yes stop_codon:yes gene_type:complete